MYMHKLLKLLKYLTLIKYRTLNESFTGHQAVSLRAPNLSKISPKPKLFIYYMCMFSHMML